MYRHSTVFVKPIKEKIGQASPTPRPGATNLEFKMPKFFYFKTKKVTEKTGTVISNLVHK